LRDIQDFEYEEIAQITGLPLGTVKSRINRGREKLKIMLSEIYKPKE
jgi:RNA polymerase sigma-70 factor (ECF subfamily)